MPYSHSPSPSRYDRGIAVVQNTFTPRELAKLLAYCQSLPIDEAQVGGQMQGEDLHVVRNSDVAWVSPNESIRWFFEKLTACVLRVNDDKYGFVLAGMQDPQFTVYRGSPLEEQHYNWHIDDMGMSQPRPAYRGDCRKLSVVLQLSKPTDYEGGDLHIQAGEDYTVLKALGCMAIFPSWTRHKVSRVTKGLRHTLVCWMYGPEFT